MSSEDLSKTIEPTVEAFMDLGFQKYESQVLAILSAIGTSTVKDIHKHTDVPLPKVYQTIESLARKNLIKQHSKTRPVQYTVYSPDIILRSIQQKNREREDKLKDGLSHLSELTIPTFAGEISPFNGISAFTRIGKGLLANVKKELSVAMSAKTLAVFKEDISQLQDRDVNLRSMSFDKIELLSKSLKAKLFKELGFAHYLVPIPNVKPDMKLFKVIKSLIDIIDYLGIIISDNGESLIILPLFPNVTIFGIWVHSAQIVERQLNAYNELFKIAKKAG